MPLPLFRDLKFGLDSAEDEASRFPDLLLKGFYDPFGICKKIESGDNWLILGPKGSGKSAITEHLRLQSKVRRDWFSRRIDLNQFPFLDLADLDIGGKTAQARLPALWTYLLSLELLVSFNLDKWASGYTKPDFKKTIEALERNNILPTEKIRDAVYQLQTVDLKVHPPGFEVGAKVGRTSQTYPFYVVSEALKYLAVHYETRNRHFLFIDGLDTLTIGEDDQKRWEVLTALLIAADGLSRAFREEGGAARIAVLCRSDLFSGIDYPDIGRLKGSSTMLDWFPSTRHPEDSHLFELAEKKAGVEGGDVEPLVKNYLPSEVSYGRVEEIHSYLMSHTRFTPRDYLQLLTYIAHLSPRVGLPGPKEVIEGVKNYSSDYFIDEVRAGLFLALGRENTQKFMDLLHMLNGNRFRLRTLNEVASSDPHYRGVRVRLIPAIQQLHKIGAIANVTQSGEDQYMNFIFHNRRARLDINREMIMHNALTKGLNTPRKRASSRDNG